MDNEKIKTLNEMLITYKVYVIEDNYGICDNCTYSKACKRYTSDICVAVGMSLGGSFFIRSLDGHNVGDILRLSRDIKNILSTLEAHA